MKPFLSIVIPSFNEEENFKKGALKKVAVYLRKFPFLFEVILVDDGSEDKTPQLLQGFIKNRKNWQLIKNSHQGKAAAVATGVKQAKAENILFTDFDQSTPLSEVDKLLPFLKKGFEIVIGSREIKGAKREKEPLHRHLMGKVFNLVVRLIAVSGIYDTQCGFKIFKAAAAKQLFPQLKIYKQGRIKKAFTGAFDVEVLYLAQKKGFKIAEVPIFWQHYKTSRVNPLKDSVKMFFDVLKIRFYDLMGRYGQ